MSLSFIKKRPGERFDKIIEVFERVRQQDVSFSLEDKFDYWLK